MNDPIRQAAIKFIRLRREKLTAKKKRNDCKYDHLYSPLNASYQRACARARNALYRLELVVNRDTTEPTDAT